MGDGGIQDPIGAAEAPPNDAEDGTLDLRIAAVFAILAAGVLGGLPPLFLKVFRTPGAPLPRLLRALAAGIILALACIHVLPDAYSQLGQLAEHDAWNYDASGCAVVFGILLMIMLQGLAHGGMQAIESFSLVQLHANPSILGRQRSHADTPAHETLSILQPHASMPKQATAAGSSSHPYAGSHGLVISEDSMATHPVALPMHSHAAAATRHTDLCSDDDLGNLQQLSTHTDAPHLSRSHDPTPGGPPEGAHAHPPRVPEQCDSQAVGRGSSPAHDAGPPHSPGPQPVPGPCESLSPRASRQPQSGSHSPCGGHTTHPAAGRVLQPPEVVLQVWPSAHACDGRSPGRHSHSHGHSQPHAGTRAPAGSSTGLAAGAHVLAGARVGRSGAVAEGSEQTGCQEDEVGSSKHPPALAAPHAHQQRSDLQLESHSKGSQLRVMPGAGIALAGMVGNGDGDVLDPHVHGCTRSNHRAMQVATVSSDTRRKQVMAMLFELACVVHSVIIGIAIGVQQSSRPTVRGLLIALCFHQCLEGIALGGYIVSAGLAGTKGVLLIVGYALTCPVGVVIGICTATRLDPSSLTSLAVQGTFSGVCGGMLLYIALVMLVAEDFSRQDSQREHGEGHSHGPLGLSHSPSALGHTLPSHGHTQGHASLPQGEPTAPPGDSGTPPQAHALAAPAAHLHDHPQPHAHSHSHAPARAHSHVHAHPDAHAHTDSHWSDGPSLWEHVGSRPAVGGQAGVNQTGHSHGGGHRHDAHATPAWLQPACHLALSLGAALMAILALWA